MKKTETIIMTISGGPRKDGASARMLQCFTESLLRVSAGRASGELSFVFRHYDAYDGGFAPCTDCRACRHFEGCVHRDMDDFWRDFENADGIVIAAPIYNLSFPAPLKTIIDRMQRYYNARFFLGKKPPIKKFRPVAFLTAAGDPQEDGAMAACQLRRIFTVTHCELVCHAMMAGTDATEDKAGADAAVQGCIPTFLSALKSDITK